MTHLRLPAADEQLLALALPAGGTSGSNGLFDDAAPIRRWSRENAVVMGGGCALLLEIAHPLVAAGVARHSDFRSDPFGRLQRTLTAMGAIVFGSAREAVAAARSIERVHEAVQGTLGEPAGALGADARYSGRASELVAWVWATLAWTTVRVHERLLEPLEAADLDAFHADQARVARLLGLPVERAPATRAAFLDYFESMRREQLVVTDEARAIADALFSRTGAGLVAGVPGSGLARALATSLLPGELRAPFRLTWSDADEERLDRFANQVRRLRRR
jgi:uncharacterized protein (DUF2236 family)